MQLLIQKPNIQSRKLYTPLILAKLNSYIHSYSPDLNFIIWFFLLLLFEYCAFNGITDTGIII